MNNIYLNSQQVQQGDVFVALQGGMCHGAEFAADAIANGATTIISDKALDITLPPEVTLTIDEHIADTLHLLADKYYPNAKKQKIIAITGTNGKTSVASFISQILDNFNVKNQIIGTLTHALTTPDIFSLYQTLHNFDGEYSILEVSSHALTQGRTKGLEFELAIWTNLSQDHLDYHHTMEAYGNAKLQICKQAKFGIFNADDEFYTHFRDKLPHNTYSLNDIKTTVKEFGFLCNIDNILFEVNLLGAFNIYNILATYQAVLKLGFDKLAIIQNIANLQHPPGRMQKIANETIWVDFAHTPDGLKNALQTLKNHYPTHNITVVFGCGGNRDTDKRAKMGKVAGELANRIILTNDNPRDENPEDIINDIISGTQKEVQVILDRKLAIQAAISGINADDEVHTRTNRVRKITTNECVLIAGKGAENYQIIDGEQLPFNDVEVVQGLL
jgi:UDP-N-acetylmuramoyl-L-alanyl-D-glutamate--2,6-diaminopimelate ligase